MKRKPNIFPWRNANQLRGVASQLTAALRSCTDGAYVELDIKTARNLLEICSQAIHTEVGHEPTVPEIIASGGYSIGGTVITGPFALKEKVKSNRPEFDEPGTTQGDEP